MSAKIAERAESSRLHFVLFGFLEPISCSLRYPTAPSRFKGAGTWFVGVHFSFVFMTYFLVFEIPSSCF